MFEVPPQFTITLVENCQCTGVKEGEQVLSTLTTHSTLLENCQCTGVKVGEQVLGTLKGIGNGFQNLIYPR